MKPLAMLLAIALTLVGCNGCGGTPAPAAGTTLMASQVYQPHVGEVWTFQNEYGDTTKITQEAPGPSDWIPSGCVVWHYTKSNARAYWQPGWPGVELWFVLCPNADGSWSSVASLYSSPSASGTQNFQSTAAAPWPYLIVPAKAVVGQTISNTTQSMGCWLEGTVTWNDVCNGNYPWADPWTTNSYVVDLRTPFYSGPAMVSEQLEGNCLPTSDVTCYHEKWYFTPRHGLVKVAPITGSGQAALDPKLTITRIH